MSFLDCTASCRLGALLGVVLVAAAPAAWAQSDAAAPPLVYRSPFKTYGGFTEQKLLSWRAANDAAAQRGAGHGNAHGAAAPAATGKGMPPAAAGHGDPAGHGATAGEGGAAGDRGATGEGGPAGDRAAPGQGGATGHEGHTK